MSFENTLENKMAEVIFPGPLMLDVAGTELSDMERTRLSHPLVGGVILFARNYASPEQLTELTAELHALRSAPLPPLLIAIDQEGGRVQRCRAGFTRLPPMRRLGERWEESPDVACKEARQVGYVLAAELRAHGVDFSFAPVLDIDYGFSSVIGDRAFHRDPKAIIALAGALIAGLRQGGMAACGKHFPGHGGVKADSHLETPIDTRWPTACHEDLLPFRALPLDAVMFAHVIYPKRDHVTACFSKKWHGYLRRHMGFQGAVFSDDLSMKGASGAGEKMLPRAEAAYRAGCDMLLVCNAPEAAEETLAGWRLAPDAAAGARIQRLFPDRPAPDRQTLSATGEYREAVAAIARLTADGMV